jgi:hypothetical protein
MKGIPVLWEAGMTVREYPTGEDTGGIFDLGRNDRQGIPDWRRYRRYLRPGQE